MFDQETFRCIVLGSVIDSDLDSVSVSIFCGGTRPSRASSHRTQGSTGLASFSSGSRFRSIYSSARRQPPRHETSSLETIRRTHSVSGITQNEQGTMKNWTLALFSFFLPSFPFDSPRLRCSFRGHRIFTVILVAHLVTTRHMGRQGFLSVRFVFSTRTGAAYPLPAHLKRSIAIFLLSPSAFFRRADEIPELVALVQLSISCSSTLYCNFLSGTMKTHSP